MESAATPRPIIPADIFLVAAGDERHPLADAVFLAAVEATNWGDEPAVDALARRAFAKAFGIANYAAFGPDARAAFDWVFGSEVRPARVAWSAKADFYENAILARQEEQF